MVAAAKTVTIRNFITICPCYSVTQRNKRHRTHNRLDCLTSGAKCLPIGERGQIRRDSLVNGRTSALVNVKFIDGESADFLSFAVNAKAF